jgi:hypothetical protein
MPPRPSHSMPTKADRCHAIALSPPVLMRTRAGTETQCCTVNDRDIVHDSSPLVHTRLTDSHLPMPHRTHKVQKPSFAVTTKADVNPSHFLSLRHTQAALMLLQYSARDCERDGTRPTPTPFHNYAPLSHPVLPHDPIEVDMPLTPSFCPSSPSRRTAYHSQSSPA